MTSKQKLANRNEKSQGEFQKKDETKRVPQAQEIDYSREITTKKELLEAQTNTSRSARTSSFISFLFQDHSFSDRIFKSKCGVSRRLLEFNENKVGLFIKNEVKKSIPAALTTLFICFSILVTLD